jgi:hypothetical protein
MVAAETGIGSVDLLEFVDDSRRRQAVRREPSPGIGEASRDGRHDDTDRRQANQSIAAGQRRPRLSDGGCVSSDIVRSR